MEILGQQTELSENRSLIPGDVLVIQAIAADIDDRCERDTDVFAGRWDTWYALRSSSLATNRVMVRVEDKQPIYHFIVGEAEYELIDHTINANGTAEKL